MEPWLTSEWMSMPRDQLLLPANYEDYDVLAMPSCLSREARLAIQEFRLEFGSRLQCQDSSEPAVRASGPDGHVLVIAASLDACTTLTFDQLPEPQRRRIRLIHDRAWQGSLPEEMVGASAVVFVRALFDFAPWIDHARSLGIPHYYSLDDNLMLLAAESRYWVQYGRYTDTEVREALKSFSGVLLSTPELIEYFRERQLHERLHYYPPVAKWDSRRASPSRQSPGVRIGFLGGPHRHEAFVREVLPAIRALGNRYELELIVMGVPAALLEGLDVKTVSLDYEHTHDLALRRMNAEGIDILVHPSSATANNRYKTLHVLINACAIGAAPILSNEPPYDILADEGSFALCDHDVDAWQRALVRFIESPALRARAVAAAERYCEAHYSGRANAEALDAILASHPSPGLVLRDARYRKLISSLKRNAATRSETPSILPVPVFSSMSYRVRPENGSVSELWTMLGSMTGGAISGEVRIEIIDPRSRAVLRQSSIQIEDLDDWSTYTFSFEKLETTGEDLILRFVPQTSGRLAVFETSTHCRRFWRRVLRKARLDLAGRDISYRLH
jgi:glycosyltransferase involved in cell wall biosynthesis